MDSKNANLEERLRSLLVQLTTESGILERIVHKSKNQHRGSLYFQALLKVRRDLRLLQSAGLGQILDAFVPIIKGTSPVENARHTKRNKKKCLQGKHTYQNRLLGVARILSQMVEPILKAAIQISLLLAKSFFMGFSLTILACLARLRVLVQQILIDVVSVFNMASAHSQKHSLKVSGEGIEACVEYYTAGGGVPTLECIWEIDKYVLREISQFHAAKIPEEERAFPLESRIEYEPLELLGQVSEIVDKEIALEKTPFHEPQPLSILPSNRSSTSYVSIKSTDCKNSLNAEPAFSPSVDEDLFVSSMTQKSQTETRKRAAFIAVQIPKPSKSEFTHPGKKMRVDSPNRDGDDTIFLDFPFSDASKNVTLF
ncbi:hypothetical protein KSP40_PGU008251 [Platanthera guangdongensis]|uniref:Nucleolus and neural progenitor protein-like N-terminal domain-containing protein n=1 Tax=Platanthera guangdongensis TaxID=2320717 RepID=A0ABR2M8V2_9ASPA